MLKIIGIDERKLKSTGFEETPNGFSKVIPNTQRFCYTLYILPNDIYGTITGKAGGGDVLDYEEWLSKLGFRCPDPVVSVKTLISDLQASGAITANNEPVN